LRTEEVAVTNSIARKVLASLKSGAVLKGTVCSQSTDGSMDIVLISIDLPAIGERQVAVKTGQNLQSGQEVVLQCVPNPLKPERYMFRIMPEESLGSPASMVCCSDIASDRSSWQSFG
jgi:hypothetical protein